ncbi:Cytolysin, a secreted calcineurin-like phosphatase [Paenibacillus tianmuensis]|uniref:Cytolysin, a secreted calcineurin-like phosphatase n=1 Tax=Paenibacillus tianmuensis TaxID=624147 RepID=A0A1G4RWU9_9BACL|nr:Cytolysin, a secreted calcineurin-like phosphatase [Paenibacillus tianmuensis]
MTVSPGMFSVIISSDPQYPWYDGVLPEGLKTEDEIKLNSARQISEQYESMNELAKQRRETGSLFPVHGVLINGDLTAFGHDWQMEKYKELLGKLELPYYPGLGNHDYANNVDDSYNNNCAMRMVDFMYGWLRLHTGMLKYDFAERSYYKFPELRVDYTGSLAYSFNIGKVHFVQLQNFPSYTDNWDSWNAGSARRDFFFIKPSFAWLKNDLAIARNRGDVIIVSLHDYHDNFIEPFVTEFNDITNKYGVSAVFAGHIHRNCGKIGTIGSSNIPFFRSGAASYQDYLVADIDTEQKKMIVRKRACPLNGMYDFTGDSWECNLNDTIPYPPMPVPPTEGHVTFFNDGGFEARFELHYTYGGETLVFKTGNMTLGNKKTYYIPPDATDVWIIGQEYTGLVWEGWRTVFDLRFASPPNNCFKLYGTTLHPKWNNDCS